MGFYSVKSDAGSPMYLDILGGTEEDLEVLIIVERDGYRRERYDRMPRELFDLCLRTGYITVNPQAQTYARTA